ERMQLFALGMFASLTAAALWLHFASALGLPVSTTHSIVGAIFGFGLIFGGADAIAWGKMAEIVSSWILSPILGGIISLLLFIMVRRLILESASPLEHTRKISPFLVGIVFVILSLSFLYKGLKNLHLDLPLGTALTVAGSIGLGAGTIMYLMLGRNSRAAEQDELTRTEGTFRILQVITACYVAFAHGANDVANAVGPLAAVNGVFTKGAIMSKVPVPTWILLMGGAGIVLGLAMYGRNVITTIGKNITEMTPSRGFCAEFGAATTVLVCSKLGLPISTTHTLVGAVIGVGLARGIATLDFRVIRNVIASWFITIPATAVVAVIIFLIGKLVL
ncbi:MAG: inorganic phosphate transporter, partial [Thermodesulfobacteriota bacterium]